MVKTIIKIKEAAKPLCLYFGTNNKLAVDSSASGKNNAKKLPANPIAGKALRICVNFWKSINLLMAV